MSKFILFPTVALLLLAASASAARDFTLNRSMIRFACNRTVPASASVNTDCVQPLLNLLMFETPVQSGYNYRGQVARRDSCHSYGHATCVASMGQRDCGTCLGFLAESANPLCGEAVGARLNVTGCSLRYEEFLF